ncbi:unnamed protein product [Caenorhabditis nigoni]
MPPRKENAKKTFTESQRARKNAYEQARKAKKNGPMEELRALTRHRFSSDFQPEGAVIEEAANYIDELRRMLAEKEAAQKTNQIEMEEFDPEKAAYEMFGMSQPSSSAQSTSQPTVVISSTSTSSEASYSQWNGYQEPQHEMFEPSPTIAQSEMFGMSQPSSTAQSASPLAMVVPNTTTSFEATYNQWNGYQEQYRMSPPWSIAESVTPPTVFVPNMSPDGVYNGSASPPSSIVSNSSTSSEAIYNQWNGYHEPQQQQYYYPPQVDQQQHYNEYLMNGGQYY